MGDPRRLKKLYSKPRHPWQRARMEVERELTKDYGLPRKNELWKVNSQLKRYFDQAKEFIASTKPTVQVEKEHFLRKLKAFGLLKEGAQVEDALSISLKDLMERRLQTVVVRKNLARSMDQARQFITHEHIAVGDKKITRPSYMVTLEEEAVVGYASDSPYGKEDHPEINIKSKEELKAAEKAAAEAAEEGAKAKDKEAADKEKAAAEAKKASEKAEEKKAEDKPAEENKPKESKSEEKSEEKGEDKPEKRSQSKQDDKKASADKPEAKSEEKKESKEEASEEKTEEKKE